MGMGTVYIVDPTQNKPMMLSKNIVSMEMLSPLETTSSDHNVIVSGGSIQEAIDSASAGDTILLSAGNDNNLTFNENIVINKNIIIKPYGNAQITINPLDTNIPTITITPNGNNSTIQGFIINGGLSGFDINANYCTITNNTITNNLNNAININGNYNVITANNLTNDLDGIILQNSSNNIISQNYLTNNNESGLTIKNNSTNNKIYKNFFINNTIQSQVTSDSTGNLYSLGIPIGGNYWSNYNGIDANNDGFGDIPYTSNGVIDYFPIVPKLNIQADIGVTTQILSDSWNIITTPKVGDYIISLVTVTNNGPETATGVNITNPTPKA